VPFDLLRGNDDAQNALPIGICGHAGRRNGRPLSAGGEIGASVMPRALDLAPLAGFAGLMLAAAIEDCRRLVIPNAFVVALLLLWPFFLLTTPDKIAALWGLGCAVLTFLFGAILFARGYCGGGDVKLLAVASLWAGAGALPPLLVLTALFGGGLALFLLTPLGMQLSALRRPAADGPGSLPAGTPSIPYGLAIAAAALIVTIPPHFH
jgi:prepilin peptidase CpaA